MIGGSHFDRREARSALASLLPNICGTAGLFDFMESACYREGKQQIQTYEISNQWGENPLQNPYLAGDNLF